jgi:hypothetical protein
MTRTYGFALTVLSIALVLPAARAGEMKAELDCATNVKRFDTYFGRYGYWPTRTILREPIGVHFRLPPGVKNVGQTGLYSYFALAGDFEVEATFQVLTFTPPKEGYGVSVGIGVDTDGPGGSLALTRSHRPKEAEGYVISRGIRGDGGMKYETTHTPSKAKAGRLVIRREKSDLICLVADDPRETPHEIGKVPFTDATVRKVRLFADSGGSPTTVDARISGFKARAEEITGAVPERDKPRPWGWYVTGFLAVCAAVGGFVWWRRRRAEEDD